MAKVKIMMRQTAAGAAGAFQAGYAYHVEPELASQLVGAGAATFVGPVVEQAVQPTGEARAVEAEPVPEPKPEVEEPKAAPKKKTTRKRKKA